MLRRSFLRYGALGAAAAAAPTHAFAATMSIDLVIREYMVELIDGSIVYQLLFAQRDASGAVTPRPVLRAKQGDAVTIRITNESPRAHGFAIPGVSANIPPIGAGQTGVFSFTAPAGGSYLYLDPTNAPFHHALGLAGAFIVTPRNGKTLAGSQTPYSAVNPAIAAVFDALGTTPRFPGNKWLPNQGGREKLWILGSLDPAMCAAAERGETMNPAVAYTAFKPRYFTINGLSGYDLHDEPSVVAKGYIGQPTLIRTFNVGLCTHAPHIHGNHVFELSTTNAAGAVVPNSNINERDTWIMGPLARKDVLLPFEKPKDVPPAAWPPRDEPFPMRYVMHCHTEMSQTAAGGNYPQGMVTHWELLGLAQVTYG